jgi:hypothetical protein
LEHKTTVRLRDGQLPLLKYYRRRVLRRCHLGYDHSCAFYSFQNLKARYFPEKSTKSSRSRKPSVSSKTKELVKPGVLALKNQKPKYQITDPSGIMSERSNATLVVGWNIQPWVGALVWDQSLLGSRIGAWKAGKVGRSGAFDFPPLKSSKTETVKAAEGSKTPEAGSASPAVSI